MKRRFTDLQVREIRAAYLCGRGLKSLAFYWTVNRKVIQDIVQGRTYKTAGGPSRDACARMPPLPPDRRYAIWLYILREANMKRLYEVTIERTVMVIAENDDDAEKMARDHERDEILNDPDFVNANPILKLSQVPEPWRECIPYGGDDDRNCQQIFDSQQASAT